MADSVVKPATGAPAGRPNAQLYQTSRPVYRPPATKPKNRRRGCCCRCCLWTTVALLVVILLLAIAGVVFYLLYRPHRPSFAVSSLKIQTLNFTAASQSLTTSIHVNVTARNPNKRITFSYNPLSVSVQTAASSVLLGEGSTPQFTQGSKSDIVLEIPITQSNHPLDDNSAKKLSSILSSKDGVDLEINAETKVETKMGAIKLPRVPVTITCDGITGSVPTGNSSTSGSPKDSSCNVRLKFKIWKWTF